MPKQTTRRAAGGRRSTRPKSGGEPSAPRARDSRASAARHPNDAGVRIGQAAAVLGVSVDTLRRWENEGRLHVRRSAGGQRLVSVSDVRALLGARRGAQRRISKSSARNHFDAVVLSIVKGAAAASIEMQAGPHRLVALTTAEAAEELELKPGTRVVASVKATNVIVGRADE